MLTFLPPPPEDASAAIYVLFVGRGPKPTKETIRDKFHPLLVSLSRVRTICRWLVGNNAMFLEREITSNDGHLEQLSRDISFADVGLPSSASVLILDSGSGAVVQDALTSGYAYSDRRELIVPDDDLLIENIGYANKSQSSVATSATKACTLEWIMQKKPHAQVTDGTRLFHDREPAMLSFAFSHLDPNGIGSFFHPTRVGRLALSMCLWKARRLPVTPTLHLSASMRSSVIR